MRRRSEPRVLIAIGATMAGVALLRLVFFDAEPAGALGVLTGALIIIAVGVVWMWRRQGRAG